MSLPAGLHPWGGIWRRELEAVPLRPWQPLPPHPALGPAGAPGHLPVALDLETTGLAGAASLAFLIGLAIPLAPDRLRLVQLVLPDLPQEGELFAALEAELAALPGPLALVTFNGARFDLPLLQARARLQRRPLRLPPDLDLLPVARHLYRGEAGSCRLVHLEGALLGAPREDDLPGYLVPPLYFAYLRRQDPEVLLPVLHHNARDLAATLGLVQTVAAHLAAPVDSPELSPALRLGRARLAARLGQGPEAEALYLKVLAEGGPLHRSRAAEGLLALYRRAGRAAEAEGLLERLCAAEEADPRHLVAWAKLLEHRRRDFAAAEAATRRALSRVREARRLLGPGTPAARLDQDLTHRLDRLRRRLGRGA